MGEPVDRTLRAAYDVAMLPNPECPPPPEGVSVPVFDCHVLLAGPDENGRYTARAANVAGITGGGNSERQALLSVVTAFKAIVTDLHKHGEPIPWKNPPDEPAAGETERWVPVHL